MSSQALVSDGALHVKILNNKGINNNIDKKLINLLIGVEKLINSFKLNNSNIGSNTNTLEYYKNFIKEIIEKTPQNNQNLNSVKNMIKELDTNSLRLETHIIGINDNLTILTDYMIKTFSKMINDNNDNNNQITNKIEKIAILENKKNINEIKNIVKKLDDNSIRLEGHFIKINENLTILNNYIVKIFDNFAKKECKNNKLINNMIKKKITNNYLTDKIELINSSSLIYLSEHWNILVSCKKNKNNKNNKNLSSHINYNIEDGSLMLINHKNCDLLIYSKKKCRLLMNSSITITLSVKFNSKIKTQLIGVGDHNGKDGVLIGYRKNKFGILYTSNSIEKFISEDKFENKINKNKILTFQIEFIWYKFNTITINLLDGQNIKKIYEIIPKKLTFKSTQLSLLINSKDLNKNNDNIDLNIEENKLEDFENDNFLIYSLYSEMTFSDGISSIQKIRNNSNVSNYRQNLITISNSNKIGITMSSNNKRSGILSISTYSKGDSTIIVSIVKNINLLINSNPELIEGMNHTFYDINAAPVKSNKNKGEIMTYFLEPGKPHFLKLNYNELGIDPEGSLSILVHSLSKNPPTTTVFINVCVYES